MDGVGGPTPPDPKVYCEGELRQRGIGEGENRQIKDQNKHPSSGPAYHREIQIEAGRARVQRQTYPMLAGVRSESKLPSFPGDGSRELYGHF